MLLPYADEPNEEGTPWVNWLLIALNTYLFLTLGLDTDYDRVIAQWGFTPSHPRLATMLSSMFLHANFMHLLGNMWFLYLFGDNVECKIGHVLYLLAYLLAGAAGDLSYLLFFADSGIPSIGASGAIFGVLGMYIVLFPFNRVKIFYFFFIIIGRVVVRAVWVIGTFFFMEVVFSHLQVRGGAAGGIGHLAHAGGFVAGAGMALLMVLAGMLPGKRRDLLALALNRADSTIDLEEHEEASGQGHLQLPGPAPAEEPLAQALSPHDPRYDIIVALHSGRSASALRLWSEYALDHLDGVLPVREQLEIALALDRAGALALARDAYERLLARYGGRQPYAAEAQLALAGMLLQYTHETGDARHAPLARKLLRAAAEAHPDPSRRTLARQWLAQAENRA